MSNPRLRELSTLKFPVFDFAERDYIQLIGMKFGSFLLFCPCYKFQIYFICILYYKGLIYDKFYNTVEIL